MLQLQIGRIYNIKVVSVEVMIRRPSFTLKSGGTFYNYIIDVEISGGESGRVEYSCKRETVDEVKKYDFLPGVYQKMKVKKCSELGCEVETVPDVLGPDPAFKVSPQGANPTSQLPVEKNIYAMSSSGANITFAMAYAKDLLVAEIGRQPEGYRVTEGDITRMMSMAGKIAFGISEYVGL